MTNRSDNNDSSTETSTNGKNPKKTLAKRGGTAGGKRVSTLSTPLSSNESYVNGHLSRVALASLAILTFITFVGNFTQLQLSAALPTIVSEFGISVTTGQWLTSIFQLVMGVMVPLTAFLTRRFTTRQIVIVSMTVFAVGSLLAWVGPTFLVVLAGRLLEAVGTGVMWPVLQITVFSIYPLSRRGMAMGAVGMAMSVAPALGPTFGGFQTDSFGWRSIFFTLTMIGVFCLLLAIFGLRNFGTTDDHAKADFFSVAMSVLGFGGLMFGFTNIESYAPSNPMVWGAMLVGLCGIVWFVVRQVRRAKAYTVAVRQSVDESDTAQRTTPEPPLLDLGVLRNRSFTVGTICAALSFFAFSSIMVIMPLYIQNDRGYSATISGLVMMPGAFGMCISQFFGGKLLDRLGARPVALEWHAGSAVRHHHDESDRQQHVDLVGIDMAVRAPDRHGFHHHAHHHLVAQLPRPDGGVSRVGGHQHGPADRGCDRSPRAGHPDGDADSTAWRRRNRREHLRHAVDAASQRVHRVHTGAHRAVRRQRSRCRILAGRGAAGHRENPHGLAPVIAANWRLLSPDDDNSRQFA